MLSNFKVTLTKHINNNINTYMLLFLAFTVGICAGAFTVNGLSFNQSSELTNYFYGFLNLINHQNIDSVELFKITVIENFKLIALLWVLGVTIIGVPFIYIAVGIKGFVTGFSSGFIVAACGIKGVLFVFLSTLPKEIIIVPFIIALGVSGINFSLTILKSRSNRLPSKISLKSSFAAYCLVTALFSIMILVGALFESYVSPMFIKMIAPLITGFK